MRRAFPLRLLAAACALPLLLSGCGDDATPAAGEPSASPGDSLSPEPSDSESKGPGSTAGELPSVSGDFGDAPTVTIPDGDPSTDLQVKTLEEGTGDVVEEGQTVVANYLGVRWDGGETFDSSFERGAPSGFVLQTGALIPGWVEGLAGQRVGSRVLLVIPPDLAYGDSPPEGSAIQPGDTLVFVVDIVGAHSGAEAAKGTPTPTEDDGYPAVTVLPKKPEIFVPPGNPPPKLISIPVVTGKGPKVEAGDTIVVQYVGKVWRNGKQFDASWDRGQPFVTTIGVGSVIKGWDQGVVGQTVGSRVLLVVPPRLGYGDTGSGEAIKPGDTLVFAVDILAAY